MLLQRLTRMQAEAGCQLGPPSLIDRGPAGKSLNTLTSTGLAAFMATDPQHV